MRKKYVAAIRLVGSRHLDAGDIPTAWAYYRVIAETEPGALSAIRDFQPTENDERLGAVIRVAFNHGVSPGRGSSFDHGTLRYLSSDHRNFEQLPPHEAATPNRVRWPLDPPPAP